MREIRKRPLALRDLNHIWRYTFDRWSKTQADRYLLSLDDAIQQLATQPETGRSLDTIRPGYRSIQVGRHIVFYTFTDDALSIRRVLHERMDVGRHL